MATITLNSTKKMIATFVRVFQRVWTKKSLEAAAENLKDSSTPPIAQVDEPKTPPPKKAKTGK